jgi:hypothetical protein
VHPEENYRYEVKSMILNYYGFYSDNVYFGYVNSTNLQNITYISDYITFFDDNNSLSLYFDRNATISMEYYNETVSFNASMYPMTDAFYRFELHPGNYTNASRQRYSTTYGTITKISGINDEFFGRNNYSSLKDRWSYPKGNEFQIFIYNSTTAKSYDELEPLYSIGSDLVPKKLVYAEEFNTFILSEYGTLTPASVNIKVW